MALMLLNDYAGFIGLSKTHIKRLAAERRISGLIELKPRIRIVDTEKARILPPPNRERRKDGQVIGRSKPLRGETGFKE